MKLILAAALAWTGAALAQKSDPATGTWNLNVAKSKFGSAPAPKSMTVTIEASGDKQKITNQTVGADGKTTSYQYEAKFDGTDYPIVGSPTADTVALKRIDAHTIQRVDKKAGKVVMKVTRVMAKNGKSFTAHVETTGPDGKPNQVVLVYEKQ